MGPKGKADNGWADEYALTIGRGYIVMSGVELKKNTNFFIYPALALHVDDVNNTAGLRSRIK